MDEQVKKTLEALEKGCKGLYECNEPEVRRSYTEELNQLSSPWTGNRNLDIRFNVDESSNENIITSVKGKIVMKSIS